MDIIKALKESELVGLGGAGFSTAMKWQAVKDSFEKKRFVICNLSEGEPGVFKDEFIIQRHLSKMISGIEIAAEFVNAQKSYIFLNDKYKHYQKKIERQLKGKKIEVFIDTGRYLCGEETVMLQVMEGKIRQPRLKPPYPTHSGLFGYPTLINNAETFYRVKLIVDGDYQPKRFYSLFGDYIPKKIVEDDLNASVEKIIGSEKILSKIKFARIGGLSGYFLPKNEFKKQVSGTGSIEIFGKSRNVFNALCQSVSFLKNESCGKCTPCREGIYRIAQELNNISESKSLWDNEEIFSKIKSIAEAAKESSFCPLGASIADPVNSAINFFPEDF
jgi:NADH:ubiquinone oxidoreductase subunit F (NADH-binding)